MLCPECKREAIKIIKGMCNSCYCSKYNRERRNNPFERIPEDIKNKIKNVLKISSFYEQIQKNF